MCKGPEVGHWSKWELKGWAELAPGQMWGQEVLSGAMEEPPGSGLNTEGWVDSTIQGL